MDVHYLDTSAQIAGITFTDWGDAVPMSQHLAYAQDVACYQSGEFYKRELPLLLQLIQQHQLEPAPPFCNQRGHRTGRGKESHP